MFSLGDQLALIRLLSTRVRHLISTATSLGLHCGVNALKEQVHFCFQRLNVRFRLLHIDSMKRNAKRTRLKSCVLRTASGGIVKRGKLKVWTGPVPITPIEEAVDVTRHYVR
jgi:hypothetical protein